MSEAPATKPQHTPGPWTLRPHGAIVGGEFRELVNGKVQSQIAMACVVPEGPEVQQANAELIASAPLLEERVQKLTKALRGLVEELRIHTDDGDGVEYVFGKYCSGISAALAEAERVLEEKP